MEIKIRKASPADAAAISRVFQKSWQSSYAGIIDPDYLCTIREDHWVEFFETGLAAGGGFSGLAAVLDQLANSDREELTEDGDLAGTLAENSAGGFSRQTCGKKRPPSPEA